MAGVVKDEAWQCSTCTLINSTGLTACSACENPREVAVKPVLHLGPSPGPAPGPTAGDVVMAPAKPQSEVQPRPVPAAPSAGNSAGLDLDERRAREQEMAAKRQKKEEEKQRILAQSEENRKERFSERAVGSAAPSALPLLPQPVQAPVAQSVKLQLRCPQWSRTIVFTCFEPTSTLGDVRKCLREELISGVSSTGDGRLLEDAAQRQARVPPEETMILAESAPPRRKFVSAADMQLTLLAAGLCPSSALLLDAAPIGVVEAVAEVQDTHGSRGAGRMPAGNEDDESEEEDDEEQDDTDSEGDGMPGSGKGGGKATGSGTFGNGSKRNYGGSANANSSRPGGTQIGEGGQILGSGSDSAGNVLGAANPEEQRLAREARLAALERRGLASGSAGEGPPAPAAPAAASSERPAERPSASVASTGAPSAARSQAEVALHGKKKQDAEKQEILRRIAEERAERADRFGSAPAQQPAAAASAPKPPASSRPAGRAEPVLPSADAGRIKGQMGGGVNKAERAREREAILRNMEEDRQSKAERHVDAVVVAAAIATASELQDFPTSGVVRLQIRCATSGRTVTTTAFDSSSSLSSVRDFAAAELGLTPGDGAVGPELSLSFPPRTALTAPEQLRASLGDLGLFPSATLLIKGLAAAAEQAEGAPLAEQTASGATAPCPRGHGMTPLSTAEDAWCDRCQSGLPVGSAAFECRECDYIECGTCSNKS